ncbi:hypothetical protein HPP92_017334 [Vanilla planifolia]|uniref:Uncharacterized protein n=1 Tax=Vanilla planifolia TaxID=51239 RepID=A0A835UPA8_VANPL|nr:hypothetical protein HPP92_017334 [Vanilla planifolia]
MELSALNEAGPWGNLLCEEDVGELDELSMESPAVGVLSGWRREVVFPEDSDESIAVFVEVETEHSPAVDYSSRLRSRSIDPAAREAAIAWILQVLAYYRLQPLTGYLAVNYMDRFLSVHRLPQANGWALQLLSVACLSLAAKMEETFVPSLLDLQVEGARFIFEPRTVCKMELLVLAALKWRLRSVTPFTFLDFFAYKVDPSGNHKRYLVSRASHTILAAIGDIEFLGHCSSSIAAASVICAVEEIPLLGLIDPREAVHWCIGLLREGIIECYRLMQKVVMRRARRSSPVVVRHIRMKTSSSFLSSFPANKRIRVGEEKETTHEAE